MTAFFELCETGNINVPVNNAFVLTSGISLSPQTVASRASPWHLKYTLAFKVTIALRRTSNKIVELSESAEIVTITIRQLVYELTYFYVMGLPTSGKSRHIRSHNS